MPICATEAAASVRWFTQPNSLPHLFASAQTATLAGHKFLPSPGGQPAVRQGHKAARQYLTRTEADMTTRDTGVAKMKLQLDQLNGKMAEMDKGRDTFVHSFQDFRARI